MNANQLMDAIGEVRGDYIRAAMETREYRSKRRLPKLLLIAAIVSLMVLLLGCAIAALNLRDLKIGEFIYTEPRYIDEEGNKIPATEKMRDVLSLQGIAGSPEYLAAQEWDPYEWDIIANRQEAILDDFKAPEAYQGYFIGNQEMQDKVDEICEKYNLKLLGSMAVTQSFEQDIFFESLGLSGLTKKDAKAVVEDGSGYFYECGNFKLEFWMTLTEENRWPHKILLSYLYKSKGYFDTVTLSVDDISDVEQRNHTLGDGTEVLIMNTGTTAWIFTDREEAFLSAGFGVTYEDENGTVTHMTKQDIEAVAEVLDFTVKPARPDMTAVKAKLAESEKVYLAEEEKKLESYVDPWVKNSYRELIESLLQDTSTEYTYGFADLDGDGTIELLIGDIAKIRDMEEDEKFCYTDSFTMKDGKTTLYFSGATATYLCENNRFVYVMKHPEPWYGMYTLGTGENKIEKYECLYYYGAEGKWFYNPDEEPWPQEVTEEVAMAILDSYVRIPLEMKPITEYPME